jgi:hypothetical protein
MAALGSDVTAFHLLLRLLPIASVALLLTTQSLGVRAAALGAAPVAHQERGAGAPWGSPAPRKLYPQAAVLEEFFAVDDDSDLHASSLIRIAARALTFDAPRVAPHYCEALPTHDPCAGPQTGPPAA